MTAFSYETTATPLADAEPASAQSGEIMRLISQIENLDRNLKEKMNYNFLSGEGRVLISLIKNNGAMLKVISNDGNFSCRTAYNSIKKLEKYGVAEKNSESGDQRRVIIKVKTDFIKNLI